MLYNDYHTIIELVKVYDNLKLCNPDLFVPTVLEDIFDDNFLQWIDSNGDEEKVLKLRDIITLCDSYSENELVDKAIAILKEKPVFGKYVKVSKTEYCINNGTYYTLSKRDVINKNEDDCLKIRFELKIERELNSSIELCLKDCSSNIILGHAIIPANHKNFTWNCEIFLDTDSSEIISERCCELWAENYKLQNIRIIYEKMLKLEDGISFSMVKIGANIYASKQTISNSIADRLYIPHSQEGFYFEKNLNKLLDLINCVYRGKGLIRIPKDEEKTLILNSLKLKDVSVAEWCTSSHGWNTHWGVNPKAGGSGPYAIRVVLDLSQSFNGVKKYDSISSYITEHNALVSSVVQSIIIHHKQHHLTIDIDETMANDISEFLTLLLGVRPNTNVRLELNKDLVLEGSPISGISRVEDNNAKKSHFSQSVEFTPKPHQKYSFNDGKPVRISSNSSGLQPFRDSRTGKYGYGRLDNIIIPAQYDQAFPFSFEGTAQVMLNGKCYLIDKDGKILTNLGI